MSRIKGSYLFLQYNRVRWLDTHTGCMHHTEFGTDHDARRFSFLNGAWRFMRCTFVPDPVAPEAADWYVLRHVPEGLFCGELRPASTQCSGPFVECAARTNAVGAVKTHRGPDCKVSVVQIKQGNTYSKVTPATPEPTYNWS